MDAKSVIARAHIRNQVLTGGLAAGSGIDVTEIAQALKISAVPVREALIRLAERRFIRGGAKQSYHVHKPSQHEQLDALTWARSLFQKAVRKFLLREDREFLIASIQAAAAEKDELHPSVFCFRLVDAIGKFSLSGIEYLLFSIALDHLLLTPPIECEAEFTDLKAIVHRIIELIVGAGDVEEISTQVNQMSSTVERMISLAHTQNAAKLVFKES
ncbi:putative HTH-type transcriptional regulator [Ensifer psoraleae]|uniref:GntR family transcriptional regulator n=1 Tax=Sinorhizobium psoraleae TaxID=520838 RepID=UPI001567FD15|nr:GntR family transcriptional regulator [Sinorhizobium psoraleae]NRP74523.1 putative HTH-type transcriptional regulator [Sinorhizobium psoraleae]